MSPTSLIMYGLEDQYSVERRGASNHVLSREMQMLLLPPGAVMLQAWWFIWSQRGRDGSSHGYSFLIHELVAMVDDKSVSRHKTILWSNPGSHRLEENPRQNWSLSIFIEVQLRKVLPLISLWAENTPAHKDWAYPFYFSIKNKNQTNLRKCWFILT